MSIATDIRYAMGQVQRVLDGQGGSAGHDCLCRALDALGRALEGADLALGDTIEMPLVALLAENDVTECREAIRRAGR